MVIIAIKVIILDDEVDEGDYLELHKLRDECDSRIECLNNSTNPKTVKKVNEFKKELGLEVDADDSEDKESSDDKKNSKRFIGLREFLSDFQTDIDVDPGRLLDLIDGIYGMDMTLLMVEILIPRVDESLGGDPFNLLQVIAPTVGTTMVSFIILATFWIYHHQFLEVTRVNMPFLWLNMFFLALITFLPISTFILSSDPAIGLNNFLFGITLTLTIVVFVLMIKYADYRNFIETSISREERTYIYSTLYIIFAMTVVITILDYYVSVDLIYLYVLLPIISIIRDRLFKMKHEG